LQFLVIEEQHLVKNKLKDVFAVVLNEDIVGSSLLILHWYDTIW